MSESALAKIKDYPIHSLSISGNLYTTASNSGHASKSIANPLPKKIITFGGVCLHLDTLP